MQATATAPLDSAEGLAQRVKANRQQLLDTAERLANVRHETWASRSRSGDLRIEVRAQLDRLIAGVASARDVRPVAARANGPAGHHYSPSRPDPLDVARQELHEDYARTGDQAIRAQLMESYDGFARALALKFRHRESLEDLVQVARIGLLHAIDRFDPSLGRPFPLFARITISGELKRHIRDKTWGMRVPRSLQEDYLNVMRAVDELTAEQSDSPSMEAVAERCDMTVDRVIEAMELRVTQRALSIDAPLSFGSDDPILDLGQEDSRFGQFENRQLLAQLLRRLPERDRRIVELRFIDEKTQSEIATELGVSQMCVSRVLARTLGRLRLWARTAVG